MQQSLQIVIKQNAQNIRENNDKIKKNEHKIKEIQQSHLMTWLHQQRIINARVQQRKLLKAFIDQKRVRSVREFWKKH